MNNCPACDSKRLHAPSDWEYHPYARHGWNGSIWTHPDLPYARQGLLTSIIALRDSIEAEKGILPEVEKENDAR